MIMEMELVRVEKTTRKVTTLSGFTAVTTERGWMMTAEETYVWTHTQEENDPNRWGGQDFCIQCRRVGGKMQLRSGHSHCTVGFLNCAQIRLAIPDLLFSKKMKDWAIRIKKITQKSCNFLT
jgi:hypothetical protein